MISAPTPGIGGHLLLPRFSGGAVAPARAAATAAGAVGAPLPVGLAGLIFSTAYLVDATYNPFLYFRF